MQYLLLSILIVKNYGPINKNKVALYKKINSNHNTGIYVHLPR